MVPALAALFMLVVAVAVSSLINVAADTLCSPAIVAKDFPDASSLCIEATVVFRSVAAADSRSPAILGPR